MKDNLDRWQRELNARASFATIRDLGLLGAEAIARRLLAVRVGRDAALDARVWVVGPRKVMTPGLQRLIASVLGADEQRHLRWLLGRWPRGSLTLGYPLATEADELRLGIIAPLASTRVALAEGPIPLTFEAVRHFKGIDRASEAPGLLGCRIRVAPSGVVALGARWPVAPARLDAVAEAWGLDRSGRALLAATWAGLGAGLPLVITPVIEGWYRPEPDRAIVLEVGPVPLARVESLARAALGEATGDPIVALGAALGQRVATRARVVFDGAGVRAVEAQLGPRGQSLEGAW